MDQMWCLTAEEDGQGAAGCQQEIRSHLDEEYEYDRWTIVVLAKEAGVGITSAG